VLRDLGVALYIHPNPIPSDEWKVLQGYPGLDHGTWGWNYRTGGHALRLIFGGSFDKFPCARIILGHMGEFLPAQLFRIDIRYRDPKLQKQLKKLPSEYFGTNITITTSGVFSHQALIDAIQTVGIDNVMFSIDYPFEATGRAAEFMRTAPLAPADKEKAGHANAERILRLKP
jgi:2,3-dihydroxybenzoate decarboxylase